MGERDIAWPSHKIWTDLSKQLGGRISAKALYTFVKMDRHNIQEKLGLTNEAHEESQTSDVDLDSTTIGFQLTIPFQEWTEQFVEETVYKSTEAQSNERHYTILKRGSWTHTLNQKIWSSIKCPCTLSFKRAKVHPYSPSRCLVITGHCTECSGKLYIHAGSLPADNEPVVLQCSLENVNVSLHSGKSKRNLSSEERAKVSEELWMGKQLPHVWRATKAKEMMEMGDPEPSHLPSLSTLRKAKQERGDKELGHNDPVLSLQLIKYSASHCGSIFDIGLDKFFCHYWTPSQLLVYKSLSKACGSRVSFDATGTIVKRLSRPTERSGHIFLYQGVLSGESGVHIPVVQMLSERHTIPAIANWLSEWHRGGAPVPKEAVCDFSLAILGALVKSFTPHPDLKAYINECFGVLLGNPSSTLPTCFLRVDVAHCIKMITQWECLRKKGSRVKGFYVRALAQVVQCVSIDDARQLIQSITVVALSESEGNDESGAPVISEVCKGNLKKRIADGKYNPALADEMAKDGQIMETSMNSLEDCNTEAQSWVANICGESKTLASHCGDRDNLHFLPELLPHVIRMCSYLPLWTGVMVPHFEGSTLTASSAHVEAEFKNVKSGLFKHDNLPIRLDRFVSRHLNYIEGQMRLSSAAVSANYIKSEKNETEISSINCDGGETEDNPKIHEPVENWRGLAVPPKKRKSYLTPQPEWLHVDMATKKGKTQIGLLQNGNLSKPIKVGKALVSLTNTCAFDSFCQCLCCAFCDSANFRGFVHCHQETTKIFQLITTIVAKGMQYDAFRQRAELLLNIFSSSELRSGARQVNATCNIAYIVTSLMRHTPSLVTETQCSNPHCHRSSTHRREVPLIPVEVSILEREGIKGLQAALLKGVQLQPSMCLRPLVTPETSDNLITADPSTFPQLCTGLVSHSYTTGAALFIETAEETSYPLEEFPMNITFANEQFILRGIVAFIPGPYRSALGHYVAYCRRSFSVWERYDDLSKGVSTASEKNKIKPHVVFYTKE